MTTSFSDAGKIDIAGVVVLVGSSVAGADAEAAVLFGSVVAEIPHRTTSYLLMQTRELCAGVTNSLLWKS